MILWVFFPVLVEVAELILAVFQAESSRALPLDLLGMRSAVLGSGIVTVIPEDLSKATQLTSCLNLSGTALTMVVGRK